jgi:hypothetical protein
MIVNRKKNFAVLGLTLLLSAFSADNNSTLVIQDIQNRLDVFNSSFHHERAYIFTDRYVYHAGEMIWFRGFVTSFSGNEESFSEDFYIKIFNNNGEEITFRRYPLAGKTVSDKIQLPRTLIPGKYTIVAYTGWMKNQPVREVFTKNILISDFIEKRLEAKAVFDRALYVAGDTMKVVVSLKDNEGKAFQSSECNYSIETYGRVLVKGSFSTDNAGNGQFTEIVPGSDGEVLLLSISMKQRFNAGRYSIYLPVLNSEPVISFLPEGGNLVKGIESTMFIKASDKNGVPLPMEFNLYDDKGHFMQKVATGSDGVGSFLYNPQEGRGSVKIISPVAGDSIYELPPAINSGTILGFKGIDGDSARFTLHSSGNDSIFIVAVSKGGITWSRGVFCSRICSFALSVKDYHGEIIQITAFNSKAEPVAERLVAIPDDKKLILNANKNAFLQRQRVTVTLEYTGKGYADVALSVSPQNMSMHPGMITFSQAVLPNHSNMIFTEQGSSWFVDPEYRLVDWNAVLHPASPYMPYTNQDGLSGKVVDKKDNISQLAKVRVTHIPGYHSYETQTDNSGQFRVLFGSDVIDFNYLNIEAYDASGRTTLNSSVDYSFSEKLKVELYGKKRNTELEKLSDLFAYGDPDIIYALRYNPARLRKTEKTTRRKYDPYSYRDFTNVLDIIRDIRVYDLVDNKILFRDIEKDFRANTDQRAAIIVINGVLWGDRIDILNSITPSDITNLVISGSLSDIHRYTSVDFAAVIEITTIQGMYRYRQKPFQPLRDLTSSQNDFYSPDYSVETSTSPDNRKTLYWNPEIRLVPGVPVTISFFTSDIKGIYSVRAEGIDDSGKTFSTSEMIAVE